MPLARAPAKRVRAAASSSGSISVAVDADAAGDFHHVARTACDGSAIARSNRRGRAWLPMRSASAKPRLTTSSVRSPLRSSSALVATVVPILTRSTTPGRDRRVEGDAKHRLDAGDRGVAVAARVFAEQLWVERRPVGIARDDVGEGAAAVDPELPFAGLHQIGPQLPPSCRAIAILPIRA